jgi:hypothetical protein
MYNITELQLAIEKLFAHLPPKREISTEKVRLVIAEYFSVDPNEISLVDITAALRSVTFAVPRTKLRGSNHIGWYFIQNHQPIKNQPKKKIQLKKEKSIIESQRLKK